MKRRVIWSNENLDIEDWREDYREFLEINEMDDDPDDEESLYDWMVETNEMYLDDERSNLNIRLGHPILVIADLGLWHGRRPGYREIASGNIRDCLYASGMECGTWYVDERGDLICDCYNHDGTNHYMYRVYKEGVTERQIENLKDKILDGKATRADVTRITRKLGDEIASVYGW